MRSRQLNSIAQRQLRSFGRGRAAQATGARAGFASVLTTQRQQLANNQRSAATPPHSSLSPQPVTAGRTEVPLGHQPSGEAGMAIVAAARTQLGGAYVWGGTQPGAFDCSGLTQWAVRQATGQTIPRVAADQARAGQPVARAELQPGNLVFFAGTNHQPGISHVGVYAGNGRFIHAASETVGIITSRLDDPYWTAHYAGARRLIAPE